MSPWVQDGKRKAAAVVEFAEAKLVAAAGAYTRPLLTSS